MSEKSKTLVNMTLSALSIVPSWCVLFLEHPEALGPTVSVLKVMLPLTTLFFGMMTGYHLRGWKDGRDRFMKLAKSVPLLSVKERAALLIAYANGELWASTNLLGVASSLHANGYFENTYDGGLIGPCYVIPLELRAAMANDGQCEKALLDAEQVANQWGYSRTGLDE